jgi:hypothetical protein
MVNPLTRVTFYKEFYCKTNMPPSSTAIVIHKLGDILHMSAGFMFVALIKVKQICFKILSKLISTVLNDP